MASRRIVGQVLAYALFGALLIVFSHLPRYRVIAPGEALVQISIAHPGVRLTACRRLSPAELAARAPNMRAPEDCPRARSPVRVVLEIDGRVLLDQTIAPSGLAGDGTSTLYRRFHVAAGERRLRVRVVDDLRSADSGVSRSATVRLDAGQVLSIDYKPDRGGIVLS